MRKLNTNELEPLTWSSPKGTFAGEGYQISEGLGRKRDSTDLLVAGDACLFLPGEPHQRRVMRGEALDYFDGEE
jgi:hypothetical protein